MAYVGIDLGSNSLRAVKMDKDLNVLCEYENTVRSAQDLEKSGEICKSALNRILDSLNAMKEVLQINSDDEVIALTTAAMRKAKNNKEILKEISQKTGIDFCIIDGEKEAFITSLAPKIAIKKLANKNLKYKKECFVLVDMGGGSSEFIFCKNEKIFSHSFEIGIVSAKERYKSLENLKKDKENIKQEILDFVKEAGNLGFKADFLVANSGTPTTICAFKLGLQKYNSKAVFGMELSDSDFKEQLKWYLALNDKEKTEILGEFKADVVPFGVELFLIFMEALGFSECVVVDEGIREGAVIARIRGYDLL